MYYPHAHNQNTRPAARRRRLRSQLSGASRGRKRPSMAIAHYPRQNLPDLQHRKFSIVTQRIGAARRAVYDWEGQGDSHHLHHINEPECIDVAGGGCRFSTMAFMLSLDDVQRIARRVSGDIYPNANCIPQIELIDNAPCPDSEFAVCSYVSAHTQEPAHWNNWRGQHGARITMLSEGGKTYYYGFLHELAHALSPAGAGHGEYFRDRLMDVWKSEMPNFNRTIARCLMPAGMAGRVTRGCPSTTAWSGGGTIQTSADAEVILDLSRRLKITEDTLQDVRDELQIAQIQNSNKDRMIASKNREINRLTQRAERAEKGFELQMRYGGGRIWYYWRYPGEAWRQVSGASFEWGNCDVREGIYALCPYANITPASD